MDGQAAVSETPTGTADLDARLDGRLDIDAAQLIAEIKERYEARYTIPPGAFTLRRFMAQTGYKKTKAARVLEREVEAGNLVKMESRSKSGAKCYVWMRSDE